MQFEYEKYPVKLYYVKISIGLSENRKIADKIES